MYCLSFNSIHIITYQLLYSVLIYNRCIYEINLSCPHKYKTDVKYITVYDMQMSVADMLQHLVIFSFFPPNYLWFHNVFIDFLFKFSCKLNFSAFFSFRKFCKLLLIFSLILRKLFFLKKYARENFVVVLKQRLRDSKVEFTYITFKVQFKWIELKKYIVITFTSYFSLCTVSKMHQISKYIPNFRCM